LSQALAEAWTVQLAAFRDYREVQSLIQVLKSQQITAYSEFFMDGSLQYARVRVGCFGDRLSAESQQQELVRLGYSQAIVMPFGSATTAVCIQREVGFVLPKQWSTYQSTSDHIVFWVSLNNHTSFIEYDGLRWRISQNGSDLNLSAGSEAVPPWLVFYEDGATGVVFANGPQGKVSIASGHLLWQKGYAAVILEGDMLVAYQLKQGL
jgi:hypothetical protein